MHRRFTVVLRLALLIILFAGTFGQPQPAQAANPTLLSRGISSSLTESKPGGWIKDLFPTQSPPFPFEIRQRR